VNYRWRDCKYGSPTDAAWLNDKEKFVNNTLPEVSDFAFFGIAYGEASGLNIMPGLAKNQGNHKRRNVEFPGDQ
jgi:hypothetical protein